MPKAHFVLYQCETLGQPGPGRARLGMMATLHVRPLSRPGRLRRPTPSPTRRAWLAPPPLPAYRLKAARDASTTRPSESRVPQDASRVPRLRRVYDASRVYDARRVPRPAGRVYRLLPKAAGDGNGEASSPAAPEGQLPQLPKAAGAGSWGEVRRTSPSSSGRQSLLPARCART